MTQLIFDHNLTDGDRDQDYEFYGAGDLVDISPAVDAGSPAGVLMTNYEGDIRPQDGNGDGSAGYDIGTDEVAADTMRVYLPHVIRQ